MLRERRQLSRIVGSHFLRESENKNRILLGDHSVLDPPDSIPNSEVKRNSVDGSVGSPHVRVEHRQAFNLQNTLLITRFKFLCADMAQSVERILGKDEVPSSILGISTIYFDA